MSSKETHKPAVQTTGHAWDGDLQEFNNPLPRWWLWAFYATVVFAVIYWVIYPAWPLGRDYTKGLFNTITYETSDGRQVETHWNTRARFLREMQAARAKQEQILQRLAGVPYQEIAADRELSAFAYSMAKVLFADNCAACHQSGGAGVAGLYPNLADDAWLWGGTYAEIEQTIRNGRRGFMPSFARALDEQQLDDVATFVLSLSGFEVDPEAARRGGAIFNGQAGGCYYCHTHEGTGMTSQGAANLTDAVWTVARVQATAGVEANKEAVKAVIRKGIQREMPAWAGRLDDTEIRILTFYVHQLGGGQ